MTQASQVPQSTGREKTKGTPSSSTGLPLVHLAQQVASMNPTKNPRKIKPSQPAKLSMQPPKKDPHHLVKNCKCCPPCRGVTQPIWRDRAHLQSALSTRTTAQACQGRKLQLFYVFRGNSPFFFPLLFKGISASAFRKQWRTISVAICQHCPGS